jgi:hypothetical protein
VVAADHQGDGVAPGNLVDPPLQPGVALGRVAGEDVDIASVDDRQLGKDVEVPIEVVAAEEERVLADLLRCAAGGAAAEGGDPVVRHADDDSVRMHAIEVGPMIHAHEGRHVAEDARDAERREVPRRLVWIGGVGHGWAP